VARALARWWQGPLVFLGDDAFLGVLRPIRRGSPNRARRAFEPEDHLGVGGLVVRTDGAVALPATYLVPRSPSGRRPQ